MADRRLSLSQISLGWLTLPKASAVQVIEAAAAAGFASVSVRIAGRAMEDDPGLAADPETFREVQAAFRDTGVRLLHMGGIWLDGTQPVSAFEAALAAGARLGTKMCVAVATPDRTMAQVTKDFSALCRIAAAHGIRVAMEFSAYLSVKTLEEADALVQRTGEANAGVLIDALHLFRSGGTVASVASMPPERVFLAQLCDGPAQGPERARLQTEARGDRMDPGQGELPIRDLLNALPAATPLELEAPCLAYRNMSPHERARSAAEALYRFFETR